MAYSERPNLCSTPIDRMPPKGGPNLDSLLREFTGNVDQMDRRLRWIIFEPQHEPTAEVPYPSGIVCVRSDAGLGKRPKSAFFIQESLPSNGVYGVQPFDRMLAMLEADGFTFYNGIAVESMVRCPTGRNPSPGQSLIDFEIARNQAMNDFYNRTGIDRRHAFLAGKSITAAQIMAGEVKYEFLPLRDEKLRRERWKEVGLDHPLMGIPIGKRLPSLFDMNHQQVQVPERVLKPVA